MRVLLSAYACEPNKGSEPGVGWNWALQAARFHEVWVLTRANNRPSIEAELDRDPRPNLHFVYHDLPNWAKFWKRGQAGIRAYYVLWQVSALPIATRLVETQRIDIVHHVTLNSIDMPGVLWKIHAPFVWGPVGGAQEAPSSLLGFAGRLSLTERLRTRRKRLIAFNPLVRLAIRRSRHILAANAETERLLHRLGAEQVTRELETAIHMPPNQPAASCAVQRDPAVFTILWAGQFIPRKAPKLAIDILAELKRRGVPCRMLLAGDGPLRERIEAYARDRDLQDEARFLGPLAYDSMTEFYRQGDAFLFCSLNDTSGNVVLEAMAHGLPIVTFDHQAMPDIVGPECGFRVGTAEAKQAIIGFADALQSLSREPDLRRAMGQAALQRATSTFSWAQKGRIIDSIYDQTATIHQQYASRAAVQREARSAPLPDRHTTRLRTILRAVAGRGNPQGANE